MATMQQRAKIFDMADSLEAANRTSLNCTVYGNDKRFKYSDRQITLLIINALKTTTPEAALNALYHAIFSLKFMGTPLNALQWESGVASIDSISIADQETATRKVVSMMEKKHGKYGGIAVTGRLSGALAGIYNLLFHTKDTDVIKQLLTDDVVGRLKDKSTRDATLAELNEANEGSDVDVTSLLRYIEGSSSEYTNFLMCICLKALEGAVKDPNAVNERFVKLIERLAPRMGIEIIKDRPDIGPLASVVSNMDHDSYAARLAASVAVNSSSDIKSRKFLFLRGMYMMRWAYTGLGSAKLVDRYLELQDTKLSVLQKHLETTNIETDLTGLAQYYTIGVKEGKKPYLMAELSHFLGAYITDVASRTSRVLAPIMIFAIKDLEPDSNVTDILNEAIRNDDVAAYAKAMGKVINANLALAKRDRGLTQEAKSNIEKVQALLKKDGERSGISQAAYRSYTLIPDDEDADSIVESEEASTGGYDPAPEVSEDESGEDLDDLLA